MADKSKIEWCDATWNVAYGCSRVSAGCKNCYAHRMISNRFPHLTGVLTKTSFTDEPFDDPIGWDGRSHFRPERLEIPFHWRKPRRIFVCSMSDLFHESLSDEQIEAVFGVMAATPQHQYVVLTKRLDRAVHWFEWMSDLAKASGIKDYEVRISLAQLDNLIDRRHHVVYPEWPLPNVIMCASVEDQKTADERVPILLQIPARWRGVSVEPMLSGINIGPWLLDEDGLDVDGGWPQNHDGLDLAICGAETGPGKRNFKDEWALDLRDQCKIAGVPYFFKKDGSGNGSLCGVEYHEWI